MLQHFVKVFTDRVRQTLHFVCSLLSQREVDKVGQNDFPKFRTKVLQHRDACFKHLPPEWALYLADQEHCKAKQTELRVALNVLILVDLVLNHAKLLDHLDQLVQAVLVDLLLFVVCVHKISRLVHNLVTPLLVLSFNLLRFDEPQHQEHGKEEVFGRAVRLVRFLVKKLLKSLGELLGRLFFQRQVLQRRHSELLQGVVILDLLVVLHVRERADPL